MWNPLRQAKEKVMVTVIAKLVRHGLTAAGGAGFFSDDQTSQIAGAIATVVGILWSVIPEVLEQRRKKAAG